MAELGKTMIFEFVEGPIDGMRSTARDAVFMDYGRISPPLVIRTVRPGDRMQPLGMKGMKKIKSVMIDGKIPSAIEKRFPWYSIRRQCSGLPDCDLVNVLK